MLLAIPAGQAIAGILGMFLIVPVLGIIAVADSRLLHTFHAAPAVSHDATPEPASAQSPPPTRSRHQPPDARTPERGGLTA